MFFTSTISTFVVPSPSPRSRLSYHKEAGAVVNIQPGNTDQGVVGGSLNITRHNSGILITGYVTGLTPGKHGFHIHTEGLLTNQCKDAAGHFNPFMKNHASPDDTHRHVGDLGNIVADDSGVAKLYILDSHASLNPKSEAFIGGRGIVIHAGEDDLGRGGDEGSLKTGNAGGRVGCGTIVVQENQPYRAPSHSHNQYQGYAYPSPLHGYPYHYPFGYHSYGSSIW
ncbi:unnamed protein product, partial [Meganyctiphanes norvegica]